jgi:hypothetical protein
MNPFGILSPFCLDDEQQLRQARARAAILRDDWRLANATRPRWGNGRGPGIIRRVRARVGRAIVRLGERLAPPQSGTPRVTVTARRTDTGC